MSGEAKKAGKALALKLVEKLKSSTPAPTPTPVPEDPPVINTSALVEAIEALSKNTVDLSPVIEAIEALQTETLDIGPIVKAINDIELSFEIDLSAVVAQVKAIVERPATNTKVIAKKLDELVKAMDKNTSVLSELVTVAKSVKVVSYDNQGRIKEIKIK